MCLKCLWDWRPETHYDKTQSEAQLFVYASLPGDTEEY